MPRLCFDQLTVTRNIDRSTFTSSIIATLLSYTLLITPVWAAPSSSLGTVVYADRAHAGAAQTSVGATVFSGDRLSTEQSGSVCGANVGAIGDRKSTRLNSSHLV